MKNTKLLALKAKVCGFQHVGQRLRSRITRTNGDVRHALWNRKRDLGDHARVHLIAYGLLRNVPYERIEGRCAKENKPNPAAVQSVIHAHVYPWQKSEWPIERVAGLLGQGDER